MRPTAALLLAALVAAPLPAPAREGGPDAPAGDLVPREWLVLGPVDTRFRQPFNPNAVLAKHLLRRDAPAPEAGDRVRGDKGEALWIGTTADGEGRLDPEGRPIAWAYTALGCPRSGVFLAHLRGASVLWVNGAPFPGDLYRLGTGPVPVELREGRNDLFVAGIRGTFDLRFERWTPEHSLVLAGSATLPDAVEVRPFEGTGAVRLLHPGTGWGGSDAEHWIRVESTLARGIGDSIPFPRPPLSTMRVPLRWTALRGKAPEDGSIDLTVQPMDHRRRAFPVGPPATFAVPVRKPGDPRRVAFPSAVDGSVQTYALLPPLPGERAPEEIGTVLSLHGASVDALNQARAYAPKEDFRIVCPTNRGPFGFDWQDWGRVDAYEALDHALAASGGRPDAVFLTGHSMGGHGTWHLAANDPGRWRAIAPSAGWRSFDTYAGGRPDTELSSLWKAADGASDTMALLPNLAGIPTFILHGTADDNVPLSEAEAMLAALTEAGGRPEHHFEEGAGHWWNRKDSPGADCVDWAGTFGLFRQVMAKPATGVAAPVPDTMSRSFKRAFGNRFVMVVGTAGTEEEDRELMERARYDAEVWGYRANGRAEVVRDSDFVDSVHHFAGRNVMLYGNADTNAAWEAVVPESCPLEVRRGEVRVGERSWKGGDLGCLFVHPRRGEGAALVGVLGDTGPTGTRVGYGLLPFVSGVGYPDYAVFGSDFLAAGDGGVRAAGWFDHAWRLQPGGFSR